MAQTQYQKQAPAGLRSPAYAPSPLKLVTSTGQGSLSRPTPPRAITLRNGPLKPAPKAVSAPGAAGTI